MHREMTFPELLLAEAAPVTLHVLPTQYAISQLIQIMAPTGATQDTLLQFALMHSRTHHPQRIANRPQSWYAET